MDRRTVFKSVLAAAFLAVSGALLAPAAQALPGSFALPDVTAPVPAVATDEDVAAAQVESVQAVCWRNRWGELRCRRRAPVVVVRPAAPVVVVRPGWGGRRCWINRWGNRVCRW